MLDALAFILAAAPQAHPEPATLAGLEADAFVDAFEKPAQHFASLETLVDVERFGALPGPTSGPCTVEFREATWDNGAWAVERTRVRARYDADLRLVERERWDIFGEFEYRRAIEYQADGGWTATFHVADGTVRDVVEYRPASDGTARLTERVAASDSERTWILDERRRTREFLVTVDGAVQRFNAMRDDAGRLRDVLAFDGDGVQRVALSTLDLSDGWLSAYVHSKSPQDIGQARWRYGPDGRIADRVYSAERRGRTRLHTESVLPNGRVARLSVSFPLDVAQQEPWDVRFTVNDARGRLSSWLANDANGVMLRTYSYVEGPDGEWVERVESRLELEGDPRLVPDHRLRRVVSPAPASGR